MALNGTIRSVDAGTFILASDDGSACIAALADAKVFVIDAGEESTPVKRADSTALAVDAKVVVFGEDNTGTGCYDAETVIVLAQ